MLGGKPFAATAPLQPSRARARGKIPIAPAAPPLPTSRDFVPWRFSDAGRRSAWIASSSRRPKTCTTAAIQQLTSFCANIQRWNIGSTRARTELSSDFGILILSGIPIMSGAIEKMLRCGPHGSSAGEAGRSVPDCAFAPEICPPRRWSIGCGRHGERLCVPPWRRPLRRSCQSLCVPKKDYPPAGSYHRPTRPSRSSG